MKIFQFQNNENTKFVYQNQNKTEKHSTFVEAEKLRDEAKNMFREQLGKLNQEIFNGSAEAFKQMEAGEVLGASEEKHNQLLQGEELLLSTGWTVRLGGSYVEDGNGNSVFAQNGDIYMERITPEDKANNLPKVKETLTRKSSNGKIVYRRREYLKGKDKRTVAKTYTSEDAGNIKKIKNNEVKVKYDKTEDNNPDKVKDKVDHSKIKFDDFGQATKISKNFDEDATNKRIQNFTEELSDIDAFRREREGKINDLLTNYTIKPGDTISDIVSFCRDTNGKSPKWKDVYAVNKNNLRSGNPDLIFPGEKLKLPDGYKLNTAALNAKQLANLNDWYGETKALEVRAQYTKKADNQPLFQIDKNKTGGKAFARQINETMKGSGGNTNVINESNEEVKQITPDEVELAFNEANKEEASDEQIKKAEDFFFNTEQKKEWKYEDYNKAGELLGFDTQIFDALTSRGELSGDETLEQLNERKTILDNFSQEINDWRGRYPNLMKKSKRFQEYLKKNSEFLAKELKEIDEAIETTNESANPYAAIYDYSPEEMDGKKAKVFTFNENSEWTYVTRKGPSVTSTQDGDNVNADGLTAEDWKDQKNAVLQFVPTFAYKSHEYGRLSIQSGDDYTQRPGDESMNPDKKADASVVEANANTINDPEKVQRWKEMADENALFDWTRGTGLIHIDKNGKMTLDRVGTSQEEDNLYKTATNLEEGGQSFAELMNTVKGGNESLFQAPVALWDGEVTNWRGGDGIKAQFIVQFENGKNGFVTFDDDIDYIDAITRLKQRGNISKAFYVDTAAGSEYIRYWNKEEESVQEQGIANPQHGGGMLMLRE